MAENRVGVPGSNKKPVPNAELVGDVYPDERLDVTVYLRSRAEQQLTQQIDQLASSPLAAREYLDRVAFASRYGADPASIERVEAFARAHHLAVVSESVARRSVVLAGTVASI